MTLRTSTLAAGLFVLMAMPLTVLAQAAVAPFVALAQDASSEETAIRAAALPGRREAPTWGPGGRRANV